MEALGSFSELMTNGVELKQMLVEDRDYDQAEVENLVRSLSDGEMDASTIRGDCIVSDNSFRHRCGSSVSKSSANEVIEEKAAFVEEERTKGVVSSRVYWEYFRAGGGVLSFILLAASCIVTQVLYSGTDYWLTLWTDAQEARARQASAFLSNGTEWNSTDPYHSLPLNSTSWMDNIDTPTGIYVYTILLVGLFLFSIVRSIHFFATCMSTSIKLHNNMFDSLIRAPVVFFDKNPIGRILNRFAKDIGSIDELLPVSFFDMMDDVCSGNLV